MTEETTVYTETFRDDRGQLWGFAPGAVMPVPIPDPPPEPITWRSLVKLTAKVAWEEIRAFRPGVPELCGLVVVGGAIAVGAGAGAIFGSLLRVVVLPHLLFRTMKLANHLRGWEFETFPMRLLTMIAMLWQWALIMGEGSWIGDLLAPLLGLFYSCICTFILCKSFFSYLR